MVELALYGPFSLLWRIPAAVFWISWKLLKKVFGHFYSNELQKASLEVVNAHTVFSCSVPNNLLNMWFKENPDQWLLVSSSQMNVRPKKCNPLLDCYWLFHTREPSSCNDRMHSGNLQLSLVYSVFLRSTLFWINLFSLLLLPWCARSSAMDARLGHALSTSLHVAVKTTY